LISIILVFVCFLSFVGLGGTCWCIRAGVLRACVTMLSTSIGDLELPCCVYNAAGPRTNTQEHLELIADSASGAVLCKSATLEKRTGNPLPRYVELPNEGGGGGTSCPTSMNSEGLPNAGIDYYISDEVVSALKSSDHPNKPYIVSVSGLKLESNLTMIAMAAAKDGVDGIELNLACPNVPGKPIVAYDFEQLEDILQHVSELDLHGKSIGVKLAPYFDNTHFERVAATINKHDIDYVVCTNTIGNGLMVDTDLEMASIAPNGGFGGIAGGHIKYTALANVRKFRLLLEPRIKIVGVGGVSTGRDAFDLILCGAAAVQVGTAHKSEGPSCFNRIAKELEELMVQKGYSSIEDFRGKLKPYSRQLARQKPRVSKRGKKSKGDDLAGVSAQTAAVMRSVIFILLGIIAWLLRERYMKGTPDEV